MIRIYDATAKPQNIATAMTPETFPNWAVKADYPAMGNGAEGPDLLGSSVPMISTPHGAEIMGASQHWC